MIDERLLLRKLHAACPLLPPPLDARDILTSNPQGAKWKTRDVQSLQGICWHQPLSWGAIENIAKYHTGPQSHLAPGGVESIAYTWAINRDGRILLCNDLEKATWSQGYKGRTGDENRQYMAVVIEGLFKHSSLLDDGAGEPNDLQLIAALVLWRVCKELWGWDAGALHGHFMFGKPACPGATLETVIKAVRSRADDGFGLFAPQIVSIMDRQTFLKDKGFYAGQIDGVWGLESRRALLDYQESVGLAVDGVWGPRTQAAARFPTFLGG